MGSWLAGPRFWWYGVKLRPTLCMWVSKSSTISPPLASPLAMLARNSRPEAACGHSSRVNHPPHRTAMQSAE